MAHVSQRGLSLVELLLAVTLSALLLGLALPSFADAFARARVRAAGDTVASGLAQARALALAQGEAVDLCLAASPGGPCQPESMPVGTALGVWSTGTTVVPLWHQALPKDVRLVGTRARLRYYPLPRAGTTATWTVCDTQGRSRVHHWVVSQAGRVRDEPGTSSQCPPVKP